MKSTFTTSTTTTAAALLYGASFYFPLVAGHASIFHPSMWGFNVTASTFPYDNRQVSPLMKQTFDGWWFHNHLGYPPNPGDVYQLAAGKPNNFEIACDKAWTTYGPSKNLTDFPCPKSDIGEFHTTGINDLKGCALAITYQSNVSAVVPQDFAVFSVNHTCVWTRNTLFQVPKKMPACPPGGCICAWFWIHSADAGNEQMYMNGFRCNVTGVTSKSPVTVSRIARRCGVDLDHGKNYSVPSNCTYGAKTPFYWDQMERNNMFESISAPPYYNDLYNFKDGAQNDIFNNSVHPTFLSSSTGWPSTTTPHKMSTSTSKVTTTTTATANATTTTTAAAANSTTTDTAVPSGTPALKVEVENVEGGAEGDKATVRRHSSEWDAGAGPAGWDKWNPENYKHDSSIGKYAHPPLPATPDTKRRRDGWVRDEIRL